MRPQLMVMVMIAVAAATISVQATGPDSKNIMDNTHVKFAYSIHMAVIQVHNITAPYHYSYGYDTYNATTGEAYGQYQTRYKDASVGTHYRVSSKSTTTVEFKLDTPNGFHANVYETDDTYVPRERHGRFAGSLAYLSDPAPSDAPFTLMETTDDAHEACVYVHDAPETSVYAYVTHCNVVKHLQLSFPYNITLGFLHRDTKTGRIVSLYAEYLGEEGHGRLVFLEEDGIRTGITIKVNRTGFYTTAPVTIATPPSVIL